MQLHTCSSRWLLTNTRLPAGLTTPSTIIRTKLKLSSYPVELWSNHNLICGPQRRIESRKATVAVSRADVKRKFVWRKDGSWRPQCSRGGGEGGQSYPLESAKWTEILSKNLFWKIKWKVVGIELELIACAKWGGQWWDVGALTGSSEHMKGSAGDQLPACQLGLFSSVCGSVCQSSFVPTTSVKKRENAVE